MADAPDGQVQDQDRLGPSLGPGLPVLSLKRPRHEVEHVHFALCNDTVLIVAKKPSKKFICHSLVSEFSQRYKKKWTVVLTDNSSDPFTKQLIKRLLQFLPNNPIICFDNQPWQQPSSQSLGSGNSKQNVLVTTSDYLLHCFANHYLHPKDISLLILNSCVSVDISLDRVCPYKQLLEVLRHEAVRPRIVGLMHLEHAYISNALELSKQLNHIASIYGLPVHLSRDLLAMNSYREEIAVENIVYNTMLSRPLEANICSPLKDILQFLFDLNIQECSKSFCKLKAIVAWSVDVLTMLGLWSFEYSLESVQKAFHNLEAEVNDPMEILAIQLCDSQFKVFQKLINTAFKSESLDVIHSQLVYNICDFLTPYKVYCSTALSSEQNQPEDITTDEQKTEEHPPDELMNDCPTANLLSTEMTTNLETRLVKLKSKEQFRCTIVVRSNSFAKLLSKLINYLSSSCGKYSFLKSRCITQSNKGSEGTTDDNIEITLRAVQQGVINVVVTTSDLSTELLVTSVNVMVCFDLPDTYKEYFTMKQKVRGLAPKFVLVTPEDELAECKTKLQVFKDIEEQMEIHVSDYISLKKKDKWLKYLEQDSLQCYAPFGKDGPEISMISSIHIINRYCHKIARGEFSSLHTQFITQKKHVSENTTVIKSDLYLPFGSPCQKVIEGHPIHVGNENDVEVGILKSKMDASLQCMKLLHESNKMDDDLELVGELFFDPNNKEVKIFELEDEGKGRAGTKKRRRAYEIMVPSIFKDNMPVAHEPLCLYKIEFGHSKPYHYSHASDQRNPVIKLGILSKKPLPKIPNFIIYTAECEVTVSITSSKPSAEPLRLDNEKLASVREFHQYLFQDLFKFTSQWKLSEKDGYLVVPLVPDSHAQIHFDFLKQFQVIASDTKSPENLAKASKDFTIFENKIVRRLNESASQLRCTKYVVTEVCNHLNPTSPFPDSDVAATFADYYHDRYGIKLDLEQPLLSVDYLSSRINYLCPRHWKEGESAEDASVTKEKSKSGIYLIPELCAILPLSASAWTIVRYLPTIVYRLGTLLLADELKCRIQKETGISSDQWPDDVPQPQLGAGDNIGEERLDWLSLNEGADPTHCVLGGSTTSEQCQDRDNEVPQNKSVASDHCRGHGNHVQELDHSIGEEKHDRVPPNDGTDKAPYETTTLANDNHIPEPTADGSAGEGYLNNNMVLDQSLAHNHANHITSALASASPGSVTSLHALPSPTTGPNIGPCVTLMLRALTAKSAGQYFHSERLEVLGDSLLKQEVSMELYLTHCDKDEWALSVSRAHFVSNDMLSKQGRRLGLPGYMSASLPDIVNNSLPPGFIFEGQTTKPANPDGNGVDESPLNIYRHQVLGDKLVANCVEALIGAYVVSCGRSSARRFMVWLGVAKHTLEELETLVNNANPNSQLSQTTSCSSEIAHQHSQRPCAEDLRFCYHQPGSNQLSELRHVEEEIGYCFRNKHLLLQALTHTSYSRSLALVSESYQKMEFLGDAVLDYIVTLYLFAKFPHLNHGDLTDFRSALVNNFTVAFLAVQNHLHQFLRCMSPPLIDMVGQFVEFLEEQEAKQGASWKTSVNAFVVGNPDVDENSIEVPKVLGDMFEGVVCAVFLDCGMNLDVVWSVIYPMLQPFIDYYKDNIPRSPVRELQETLPDQVTFSLARLTLSKTYVCKVSVVGYGSFEASGRTSKIAKSSVARKALQHIKQCLS